MKQNIFLRLSVKDLNNSIYVMRELKRIKDIICSTSLSNKEFERKVQVEYSSYTDERGTEEFLKLRVENKEEFKIYTFEPKGNQLKELAKFYNHFLETGEFLHLD